LCGIAHSIRLRHVRAEIGREETTMPVETIQSNVPQRPPTSEIDVFGVTDQGRMRRTNADHFLIGSFHRSLRIHATSIGDLGRRETESRGFILLVADGVGSMDGASRSSASALEAVTHHLLHASEICSDMALANEQGAIDELRDAVAHAHQVLLEDAEKGAGVSAATTLTMYAAFWPRAFVVHVGDSRMYRLRGTDFRRLTTDQTVAQMMVEAGAMTPDVAERSKLKHVLWSAIGSQEIAPQVVVTDCDLRDRTLLCSDGLTKHVTDDEISAHLLRDMSSEETCRALVNLALERGGSDNVTVVMGRVKKNVSSTGAPILA
jgi:serine/threonine protein phosphatase PrpC